MNKNQIYIFVGVAAVLLVTILIFFGILPGLKQSSPDPVTLEFWGVTDDEAVWEPVFSGFKKQYPHITVNYTRFDENNYEDMLINKLAEDKGPDIFMLKNIWTTKHKDKVFPLPQSFFGITAGDLPKTFVDASSDLISPQGDILGLPLFIDTLALLYDKDSFNSVGIAEAPKTWEDILLLAKNLTKKTDTGDIQKGGIALGTFTNVEHAFEIVSALMLQNQEPIIDQQRKEVVLGSKGEEALSFYASFADQGKTNFSWSKRLPNSLTALAEGSASAVFGFSDDIKRVQSRNPHVNLGIAPFPQFKDSPRALSYGTYFFLSVAKFSKNPQAAWEFVVYATSKEGAAAYLKGSGQPAARRDLISAGTPNEKLDVFYRQSLIAKSWPQPDERLTRRLFQDAVESIVSKAARPDEAAQRLKEQLQLLIP